MPVSGKDILPRWLRIRDAARYAGVCANTMRIWADSGYVASKRTPGGHRRIDRESLDAPSPNEVQEAELIRNILKSLDR